MVIEITGRHMEVTEAVRQHAQKRAAKLAAVFPQVESIRVILTTEKYRCVAEIVLSARRHVRLEVKQTCADMYAAIDLAFDIMEKRLRRVRERKVDHKARPSLSRLEQEA